RQQLDNSLDSPLVQPDSVPGLAILDSFSCRVVSYGHQFRSTPGTLPMVGIDCEEVRMLPNLEVHPGQILVGMILRQSELLILKPQTFALRTLIDLDRGNPF